MDKRGKITLSVLIISFISIIFLSIPFTLAETEGSFEISITITGGSIINSNIELSSEKNFLDNSIENLKGNSKIISGVLVLFMISKNIKLKRRREKWQK